MAEPRRHEPGPPIPSPDEVLAALGELTLAREELRVASQELAEQRQQIEDLVARHDRGQRWRDHLFALLPVGLLVTDAQGMILEANVAAADLFGMRPVRLLGKPLLVYVETAHRRLVRDLLGRLAQGESIQRARVTLVPRTGEPSTVDLIALGDPEGAPGRQRWVILPRAGWDGHVARKGSAEVDGDGDPAGESLRLATALAHLCTLPADAVDQQRLLSRITLVVGSAVPAATSVSITIGNPGSPDRLSSDSTEAQAFDGLQMRVGEGPCIEAYISGSTVVTDDLTADARWPRLARAARGQPQHSVLALPIRVARERAGVLNLYATAPGAFTEHSVRVGEVVASAVAAVLRDVSERSSLQALAHHLERALDSRAVIEQAKGVVMAHHGGTPDQAFARLVGYSSRRNIKLRDLAQLVVSQGGGPLRDR